MKISCYHKARVECDFEENNRKLWRYNNGREAHRRKYESEMMN